MNRRDLLKAGILTLAASAVPQRLLSEEEQLKSKKPKKLNEGDTVAVVAPATAVSDPDDIRRAIDVLNYLKLNYTIAESLKSKSGYKTRTVEMRVNDMHEAFDDSDIDAVFCIRGGYGSGQLLDVLGYELIRDNPKIFLGYSDITAMHLAINKLSGLVTFHGPVLLSSFSGYTLNHFNSALFSTEPIGLIKNPDMLSGVRPMYPIRTIHEGKAQGRLIGGNLSLIVSLMGTKYEIDTKDSILFIEDVGEEPYRIDRMLNQLALSGKLEQAKGIVFGKCVGCGHSSLSSSRVWDASLGEVLDYYLGDLDKPVFYGLLIGHSNEQATLPIGVNAEIDAGLGTLNILESGVID